jgi:hypothetical protein
MKTIHVAAIYAGGFRLLTPETLGTAFVQQDPHRNYVMTWSLNVQRQVTDNLGVVVGYVGSHAVHQQFKVDDSDLAAPNYIPRTEIARVSRCNSQVFSMCRNRYCDGRRDAHRRNQQYGMN